MGKIIKFFGLPMLAIASAATDLQSQRNMRDKQLS